jgi:hypothetical protein
MNNPGQFFPRAVYIRAERPSSGPQRGLLADLVRLAADQFEDFAAIVVA